MFHHQEATQVTPGGPDDPETLHHLAEHYGYPDTADRPYVRANMIATVDGAAALAGRSGTLGGPGDRAVFRTLRGRCDVVLVGSGTAVAENYRQPAVDPPFAGLRRALGQRAAPALAVVSGSLHLDPAYPPLGNAATVILTCRAAPPDRRHALAGAGATLVDCGDDTVDPATAVDVLHRQGLSRILCEGGPTLLGSLIGADLVDELCLTISPALAAGTASRIATGATPPVLRELRPTQILGDDDGYLYTRWTRHTGGDH
ncbi:MAG: pyrimidine reductase family protein [Gordonia sp. (in: high G+C Gram-positive bacteria)]